MPEYFVEHYNLKNKSTKDGYIFVAIKRGMYGLPQSGLLAQEFLEERVGKRGYYQSDYTPGIWIHKNRLIAFFFFDDFGVKYVKEEDKKHLLDSLNQHYKVVSENEGMWYFGITLEWDYKNRRVHISMPGYIPKALKCLPPCVIWSFKTSIAQDIIFLQTINITVQTM